MKAKHALPEARRAAESLVRILAPLCERIEIAGSIRRCKPEVGDLELVAIPQPEYNLFGEPGERTMIDTWLDTSPSIIIAKRGQRYIQFGWRAYQVDLFLALQDNWGYILMLRTGPAEFGKAMVTPIQGGGHKPVGITCSGGVVSYYGVPVSVPDEKTLFELWGMDYIEPENRKAPVRA